MKKILLILLAMLVCAFGFSQKTKHVEILKNGMSGETVTLYYEYDKEGDLQSTWVSFRGKDVRYIHLNEYFTMFRGAPANFCKFIDELVKFCNENEEDITSEINGQTVSTVKIMGVKGIYVYGWDKEKKNAYRSMTPKGLLKVKKKFMDWCDKNNVSYK